MELIKGTINNCTKCMASYSTYKTGKTVEEYHKLNESYSEYWSTAIQKENGKIKKPKGICPFCNKLTPYYNK